MTDHRLDRRDLLQAAGTGMLAVGASQSPLVGEGGVARATDGSEEVTEIEDWHDLDAVREDLDGEYVLVADLDSDTDGYDEHVGGPDVGWEPIGDFGGLGELEFTGTFDGNGREIADLVCDRPDENNVGLFGRTSGRIESVTLTNTSVTGDKWTGGLVGQNVGRNSEGQIALSAVTGDITGDQHVGGLAGGNFDGQIASAAAAGDVTGDRRVGGLVGRNRGDGEIASSAAAGDITGEIRVGGLVGSNARGEIASSFATGVVDGGSLVGGVVGGVGGVNTRVTDTYWDVETTGQQDGTGHGQGDATGLDTDQMQGETAAENMDALDFEETWQVVTDPDWYPLLQWQDPEDIIGDDPDDRADDDPDDGADDDGFGPGFGVGGTLAGLGTVGYLLKRRLDDEDSD